MKVDTFEEWKDKISVLGCPINCKFLSITNIGNCCCWLGRKFGVTLIEEEQKNEY